VIEDRDPILQQLFRDAGRELPTDGFLDQVMARVDRTRRRSVLAWCCVGAVLLASAWLLAGPLMSLAGIAMRVLPDSLVELDDNWVSQLISPVNSIAGVVALTFLGLRLVYRKIFS
jgi:hypothetical protein